MIELPAVLTAAAAAAAEGAETVFHPAATPVVATASAAETTGAALKGDRADRVRQASSASRRDADGDVHVENPVSTLILGLTLVVVPDADDAARKPR